MKIALISALLSALAILPAGAQNVLDTAKIQEKLVSYMPGTWAFAKPAVDNIEVDHAKKAITIKLSDPAGYIPMSTEQVAEFKSALAAMLPPEYTKYKITALVGRHTLEQLATDARRRIVAPKEKKTFITEIGAPAAPKGLDGTNIALWQSHGRYFMQDGNTWGWQRPRLYQTCEDLFTQSFVMPFLMPMLENAGAYVMSPHERDVHTAEYIIDNDDPSAIYTESDGANPWKTTDRKGFAYNGGKNLGNGDNPFTFGTARYASAEKAKRGQYSSMSWNADIAEPGSYAIYVSYQSLPNSATDAIYTINAADGPHRYIVNQKMGGGTWIYLGHFPLNAGVAETPIVELTNASADTKAVISADAVKIGGGMGNVARTPISPKKKGVKYAPATSGYPRFTEGSRYWLQWAGAPEEVYTPTDGQNDYNDDYRSRGLWVNWLAGGSSILPKEQGLGIPIDLSFAFHSDAGITPNDSIIGTLGIYCTDNTDTYANGTDRLAARDLTNAVMTNITNDIRAGFEPRWTRRGMWDSGYAEARVPQVPAMLLELLSHQNFADMRYGLDPTFRFAVSRAIYKGMLQFIAARDGRDYVVQPLPVKDFAITPGGEGRYTLTWAERPDSLEPSATPTFYIIEERVGDNAGFTRMASVPGTSFSVTVTDSHIHSYRVIAANEGGLSFPSEVLALRHMPTGPQVTIVNGFTRVSGPDAFDYGDVAGFYDTRDPGVPYIQDIGFVGSQFEFRRNVPWSKNEIAGMGASRADYEDRVLPGNTFDFVAVHGKSLAEAGCGFVSQSVDAFIENGASTPIVDLILGNQKEISVGSGRYGTRYKTFTAPLQQRLRRYTAEGGSLMVSGAFIATDLWNNPYSTPEVAEADRAFAAEVLGYQWKCGNATDKGRVTGVVSEFPMFDHTEFSFVNDRDGACYGAVAPDAIDTASEHGATVMKYSHTDLTAATAYAPGKYKVVALGVPFETITTEGKRHAVMRQIIEFLK